MKFFKPIEFMHTTLKYLYGKVYYIAVNHMKPFTGFVYHFYINDYRLQGDMANYI